MAFPHTMCSGYTAVYIPMNDTDPKLGRQQF